jgi:hypothetical protein
MKRLPAASPLLLLGGLLLLVSLPLQWSGVATIDGSYAVSLKGIDYAGYDVITTILLGLLLITAAFALAGGRRWGRLLAVTVTVMACLWAALVVVAAGHPTADGSAITGVDVAIGAGAYLVAVGAGLALIGAVVSFRGRTVAGVTAGVPSSA